MLERRRLFQNGLEEQLGHWEAEITMLKGKTRQVGFDATVQYSGAIAALQRKCDLVTYHISRLRGANNEAWEILSSGMGSGSMAFNVFFRPSPEGHPSAAPAIALAGQLDGAR
jgi:hypothetical protein